MYREYFEGLGTNPSIDSLQKQYKNAWRAWPDSKKSEREKKKLQRYTLVVEKCRKVAEENTCSIKEAAAKVDDWRIYNGLSSLDKLYKFLERERAEKNKQRKST